jgi:hypothetical protein
VDDAYSPFCVPAKIIKLIGLKNGGRLSPINLVIFAGTQNGEYNTPRFCKAHGFYVIIQTTISQTRRKKEREKRDSFTGNPRGPAAKRLFYLGAPKRVPN